MINNQNLTSSDSSDGYLSSNSTLTFDSSELMHSAGYARLNTDCESDHLYLIMGTQASNENSFALAAPRQYPICDETVLTSLVPTSSFSMSDIPIRTHFIKITRNDSMDESVHSFKSSRGESIYCSSIQRTVSKNRSSISGLSSRRAFLHDFQFGGEEQFNLFETSNIACHRIYGLKKSSQSRNTQLVSDTTKRGRYYSCRETNLVSSYLLLSFLLYNCVVLVYFLLNALLLLSNNGQSTATYGFYLVI